MKPYLSKALPLVLILSTIAGCSSAKVEELVGGKEAFALVSDLSQATTCEAYRIDGYARGSKADNPKNLRGYPIISGPALIGDASKATLSKVLTDLDTYLWDVAKGCEFLPGVALRLADDKTQVDVLICFSCDELEFYLNGKRVGHEDCDPRRTDLLRVAKKLFPKDDKLQSLK